MNKILPSILSSDFCRLGDNIRMLNESDCSIIHLDVMDGVFVPNISFGFSIVEDIANITSKELDVHLMIVHPENYIDRLAQIDKVKYISVHIEACQHLHSVIGRIKKKGIKAGVALNPHTPVQQLEDILPDVDLVNLMSVNPGFGGQKFIPNTLKKIKQLRAMIEAQKLQTIIEIDGGVNMENGKTISDAGANFLIVGNACFSHDDPKTFIHHFERRINGKTY